LLDRIDGADHGQHQPSSGRGCIERLRAGHGQHPQAPPLGLNAVIFFRNQRITPSQQVAFTRRFGEIEFNVFGE
jgi:hypothetical protein